MGEVEGPAGQRAHGPRRRPPSRSRAAASALLAHLIAGCVGRYDYVVRNANVVDPEAGVLHPGWSVGIRGDVIAAVGPAELAGDVVLDARGQVVAPGFIDVMSYWPGPAGVWNKIADGVTTNLAMHNGTTLPRSIGEGLLAAGQPVHFGFSYFYGGARKELGIDPRGPASAEQRLALRGMVAKGLAEGALGVSFALEYAPGIEPAEVIDALTLARQYGAPAFFHVRYSDDQPPGTNAEALEEVLSYARQTGVAVHVDHITSTGGTFTMSESLGAIEAARQAGLDVSACMYPYESWATFLHTPRFDPGWQDRYHISFEHLRLAGTGERLTPELFELHRKAGALVVADAIPERDVLAALTSPFVMIGSDAILEGHGRNHPRASGAFARVLGLYVRERRALSLVEAVRKMTILPARRMEGIAPALRRKGRLAPGMDADLVVFDAARVRDRATVENPGAPSEGFTYVFVSGVLVRADGRHRLDRSPGRLLLSRWARP